MLPPTANPEVPLTEEPELISVANTVQQPSTSDLQQTSTSKRTFEELLLDLCKNNNTTPGKPIKRKKIVHTCEIITTEKYLQMKLNEEEKKQKALLEKEEKRKRKEIAKQNKENTSRAKPKRVVDESSSDDNNDQDSDKDYHESFSEYEDEDEVTLKPGDFCIAKVFGKTINSFKLFVAKVMEKEEEGYIVSFFQRHNETMKFKETAEESYIRKSDVLRSLPQPITASSARYNNMVGFTDDLSDLSNLH